jgi:phosphoribosyl-dephospho-CoA transferase
MAAPEPFRRHDWVWVGREALLPDLAEVRRHWAAGHPFILGRDAPSTGKDCLRLGLALPGRRRLGFDLEASEVTRRSAPWSLGEVLPCLPPSWLPGLRSLASAFEAIEIKAGVYGSAAWQALTGLAYLREDSDLDLLLEPGSAPRWRLVLELLQAREGVPPRLDGEVLLPGGGAVAWREAASDSPTLLVKSLTDVALVARPAWLGAGAPVHA